MKRISRVLPLVLAAAMFLPLLSGCKLGKGYYLTVYNWADYIDESVLDDFTEYYREKDPNFKGIQYQTCDTPETMYTKLVKSGEPWDVACNADYLQGRLLRLGELQPFPTEDLSLMPNYNEYIPPYMREQYKQIQDGAMEGYEHESVTVTDGEVQGTYGIGYMWGTMGIVYNVEAVNAAGGAETCFRNWNLMWDSRFDHNVYMKNSVRESYIVGLLQTFSDDLEARLEEMKRGVISGEAYNAYLSELLGTVSEETLSPVQAELIRQQSAVSVKYDVDYDKIAMATGQAQLDYCWAGDGYKAITMGAQEPEPVILSYDVPDTGTNLFFDGWFMNAKLEKDSPVYRAAVAFVDYQCHPDRAKKNMTEIGYVSATAGMEMLEWGVENWKLATQGGTDSEGNEQPVLVLDPELRARGDSVDASYFFGREVIDAYRTKYGSDPKLNPVQYPDAKEMYKFAVVRTYSNDENDKLLEMWAQVKTGDFPTLQVVLFSCFAVLILGLTALRLLQRAKAKKSAGKTVRTKRNYDRIR